MNEVEKKLLEDHRKWFDQLTKFVCSVCSMPCEKNRLGRIALFRPVKRYKLARTATYMTCDTCDKLPADEIYVKVESWLMERGHLIL